MMLLIDGIYREVYYENVTHWVQSYESAFELLTQLVTDQWTLTTSILVDNGDSMYLPVEAFDGQPIQTHVQALQREWTRLLSARPRIPKRSNEERLKDWYLRLDVYYAALLDHLDQMIARLEKRKSLIMTYRNEKMRHLLSSKYEARLELNRKLYQQTLTNRQKNQQRLQQLEY